MQPSAPLPDSGIPPWVPRGLPASPDCSVATRVGKAQSTLRFIYGFLYTLLVSLGHLRPTCCGEQVAQGVREQQYGLQCPLWPRASFQAVSLSRVWFGSQVVTACPS